MNRVMRFFCGLLSAMVLLTATVSAANIPAGLSDEEILDLIRTGEGYYLGEGTPVDEFQVNRWSSGVDGTHQYITSYGFEILYNDKSNVYSWYSSEGALATVVEYSDWPDNHEIISGSGVLRHHFYYVDRGEGSNNYHAGTYFVNHYQDAVEYYEAGNKTEAFRSLGKALHYLEDGSTPVHVASAMYGANSPISHSTYESTVNNNLSRFSASSSNMYNTYTSMALSSIVPNAASYAYSQLPDEPFTTASILASADNAVPRAMKNVAAIMYRFYLDVT